ncbi:MAG TPA: hypothetical protein VGJ84_16385 [Polyangiaceae bacterium]|jgi:hypothetical protein
MRTKNTDSDTRPEEAEEAGEAHEDMSAGAPPPEKSPAPPRNGDASAQASPSSEVEPVVKKKPDFVIIQGLTSDGDGLKVLRCREQRTETGLMRPLREGRPITGEVVRLKPRPELPLVCDVEVDLAEEEIQKLQSAGAESAVAQSGGARKGPPQVATNEYRENWDAIWSVPARRRRELSN